jgi:hypothetical protein
MEQVQILAGSIAGLIFAAGSCSMLAKAWQSRDLSSYSPGQLILNNIGNLFYWLYVVSLPFGPIWFMHSFCTLVSLLMLKWYYTYRTAPAAAKPLTGRFQSPASSIQADFAR